MKALNRRISSLSKMKYRNSIGIDMTYRFPEREIIVNNNRRRHLSAVYRVKRERNNPHSADGQLVLKYRIFVSADKP